MKSHFWLEEASLLEERSFGLDTSNVIIENFF
jgi:KUP system potassium uptake protein